MPGAALARTPQRGERREEARRRRHARWQAFQPATRRSLERVEALAGSRLAEAIRSERTRPIVPADLALEGVTEAAI